MAVRYWEGKTDLYEFDYDGGMHSPVAGEVIYVDTEESTEYATIQAWTVTSGSWGGNNAAGKMWVHTCTSAFIANLINNDVIEDSGATKICDTTGGVTDKTGDVQTAGNWGTGEDPAVPLADDEVIFDKRTTSLDSKPTQGMLDSESGAVSQSTYDLFYIKNGYTLGIATAAEPYCLAADKMIIEGSGTYHILVGKTNQSTNASLDSVIVNNPDATVYLYSNCNDGDNAAAFTDVYALAGTVYLAYYEQDTDKTGCAVGELVVSPRNNKANNVTIIIEKDAYNALTGVATMLLMYNGTLTTDSQFHTVDLFNGTINFGTELATPEADLNLINLRQYGGTFNWYPDDDGNPTITFALLMGGTFQASGNTNNHQAKTITVMKAFEGSSVLLNNNRSNITITFLYNHGADIEFDSGAKIGVTYNQP